MRDVWLQDRTCSDDRQTIAIDAGRYLHLIPPTAWDRAQQGREARNFMLKAEIGRYLHRVRHLRLRSDDCQIVLINPDAILVTALPAFSEGGLREVQGKVLFSTEVVV
jgi:hypothetical protein